MFKENIHNKCFLIKIQGSIFIQPAVKSESLPKSVKEAAFAWHQKTMPSTPKRQPEYKAKQMTINISQPIRKHQTDSNMSYPFQ